MSGPEERILILGAGLAGLSAALAAAAEGRRALVVASEPLLAGASSVWAQGGLAAALSPDDTPEAHARDTVAAGSGLVDPAAALALARLGPEVVQRLADFGAPFDRDERGRFIQALEAAHSRARVAKVGGDGAGRAIMEAVVAAVRRTPNIEVLEGWRVGRLLRNANGSVVGCLATRGSSSLSLLGSAVILCLGGCGGLFAVTTNPKGVLGAGMALAADAGAVIADPEFVQFHPTAIDVGLDPAPLATEALRGEGALLVNSAGERFMSRIDPRGELAPRDVVARGIHRERAAGRGAFLDARGAVGAHFPEAFPAVFAACMGAGVDPRREPIPVAPAAHYHMGGVEADLEGRTSVAGLYAAGECASTGVHGANRLASNSLLEAAAVGHAAGRRAAAEGGERGAPTPAQPLANLGPETLLVLRRALSRDGGVERCGAGLTRLLGAIHALKEPQAQAQELIAAELLVTGALGRKESRGGHARSDHPRLGEPRRTRLVLSQEGTFVPAPPERVLS